MYTVKFYLTNRTDSVPIIQKHTEWPTDEVLFRDGPYGWTCADVFDHLNGFVRKRLADNGEKGEQWGKRWAAFGAAMRAMND